MPNPAGQLTYFYTDKVGLAVGGIGIIMMIAKIIDAITDVWFGNIIDHSKGGNRKYYKWVAQMMVPFAIVIVMLFTVPIKAGQLPALIYACVTNILLTAVCMTLIGTPLAAVMVIRTNSQSERETMGIFRAVFTVYVRYDHSDCDDTGYEYAWRKSKCMDQIWCDHCFSRIITVVCLLFKRTECKDGKCPAGRTGRRSGRGGKCAVKRSIILASKQILGDCPAV